ncbi:YjdF family protein [Lentilactobacillus otakiensis]|uniref:YjdF family protein n=1 Tax=Lentilactobacillus otakiensis TaxID=481720 RepID=UPI003D171276
MNIITGHLTIVFDPSFYKAIFERKTQNSYEVAQVVLGPSEPKIPLIAELVIKKWSKLRFYQATSAFKSKLESVARVNPKRLQRLARKSMTASTSSKA